MSLGPLRRQALYRREELRPRRAGLLRGRRPGAWQQRAWLGAGAGAGVVGLRPESSSPPSSPSWGSPCVRVHWLGRAPHPRDGESGRERPSQHAGSWGLRVAGGSCSPSSRGAGLRQRAGGRGAPRQAPTAAQPPAPASPGEMMGRAEAFRARCWDGPERPARRLSPLPGPPRSSAWPSARSPTRRRPPLPEAPPLTRRTSAGSCSCGHPPCPPACSGPPPRPRTTPAVPER